MELKRFLHNYKAYSYGIITFSFLYLAISYMIIYFVDFLNILNLQENVKAVDGFPPILWINLFKERSYTEYIQWFFLGLSLLLAVYARGYQIVNHYRSIKTWIFLQLGLLLMFAEDIINTRHYIVYFVSLMLNTEYHFFKKTIFASMIEVLIYLFLGLCMIAFLIKITKDGNESRFGLKLLLISYVFYGIASIASATRVIGNWYHVVGSAILNIITPYFAVEWTASTITVDNYSLGFWFMDLVFEESIELLGATFMLAALTAFVTCPISKPQLENEISKRLG